MSNNRYRRQPNSTYNTKHGRNSNTVRKRIQEMLPNIPERNIYLGKTYRIISKNSLQRGDLHPSEIKVPLDHPACQVPSDFTLANLPVTVEKSCLQNYYFPFSQEQLGKMFLTPKIIVDRWHTTFVYYDEVMHKTSFYAIAPLAKAKDKNDVSVPEIYRFSISRSESNSEHYSISLHAIVGGKEDGWLFIARLDNNNAGKHDFVATEKATPAFLKKHSAITIPAQDEQKQKMIDAFEEMIDAESGQEVFRSVIHRIAFPHMHQADASYEPGDQPEKNCPKFLRKCAGKSFDEMLAFMMESCHICDTPQFYDHNERISRIEESLSDFDEAKEKFHSPYILKREIELLESLNTKGQKTDEEQKTENSKAKKSKKLMVN